MVQLHLLHLGLLVPLTHFIELGRGPIKGGYDQAGARFVTFIASTIREDGSDQKAF